MCESMMSNKELFEKYFIKEFCELSKDRVINVRMALCETLINYWKSYSDK
jgi:hypothetical protein